VGGNFVEASSEPKSQDDNFALKIKTEDCGDCVYCLSACPFEAITVNEEIKKVEVDINKCRLCGICYSACPSTLITVEYYNVNALNEYVQKKVAETGAQELVIACRATGLDEKKWKEKQGDESTNEFLFFTLPCVGRMNLNFLLNSIEAGLQKITVVGCEEEFCRNKEGSKVMANKFGATQALLEDMGYYAEMIDFQTMAAKAAIDETKCIACGNCAFICPYDAVRIEGAAKLDTEKCMGCGLCVTGCPAFAITLESSDFDVIGQEIYAFAQESGDSKILVLGCMWSEYCYADEDGSTKEGVKFIRMPCSGRIEMLHVLKALSSGIDGVMISTCIDDICSLEVGNKRAIMKVVKLKEILDKLGIGDRVKVIGVHPKYVGMFETELASFQDEIKNLGPSLVGGGD
jgi:coenzyme F420-reducing hydrogenase delta subunit/ferredoxin